jgi:1-acyl-sn-glycerol-3-phosphate acyltransferase
VKTETAERVRDKGKDKEIVPIHDAIYYGMLWLYSLFFRLGRWKLHGRENVPRKGAVIIAPNHVSMFDPPLVGCATPRPVTTMGKAELFEKKTCGLKILGFIIQHMATFPVRRGAGDRRAIRRALQVLKDEGALVIFPEGTRSPDGQLCPSELGLGMIAHASKAPIVPVYLKGTHGSLSKMHPGVHLIHVEAFYGKPLYFEAEYAARGDRATLQAICDRVMAEIAALRDAAV